MKNIDNIEKEIHSKMDQIDNINILIVDISTSNFQKWQP